MNSTDPEIDSACVAAIKNTTKRRNIGSMMCMPHDINEQKWLQILETSLANPKANLSLSDSMKDILKLDYSRSNNVEGVIEKWSIISHVKYLESAVSCATPIFDKTDAKITALADRYGIIIPGLFLSDEIEEIKYVLVAFEHDLESIEDGFNVYQGIIEACTTGTLITVSHKDTNIRPSGNTRVTVFQKPNVIEFESSMFAIRALRDDEVVRKQLFNATAFRQNTFRQTVHPSNLGVANEKQKEAIVGMLNHDPDTPFILFGPPGTGKTTTAVEYVRQQVIAKKNVKILVCTTSNEAANVFARQLKAVRNRPQMARIFSSHQDPFEAIDLKDVTFMDDESGEYVIPHIPRLKAYDVIICTFGLLHRIAELGKEHFDVLLFDEAGQAPELLSTVALAHFFGKKCDVFFCGDPHQLGPVELSQTLSADTRYNVDTSTIARLYRQRAFSRDPRRMVTLLENYRSVEAVMSLYSNLFYEGQLISRVGRGSLERSAILDGQEAPVRIHVYYGCFEKLDAKSSFYNLHEVGVVHDYVLKAIENGVKDHEIGIITPYTAQVQKIGESLRVIAPHADVNTVEFFQGSERRVIIVSFVRTDGLGFLTDYRRLNTSVSRAQEMVIMVGHGMNLLQNDTFYKAFTHVHQSNNGIYAGSGANKDAVEKSIRSILPKPI